MATTKYCYHCGRYHPIEEMRLTTTKAGSRWRCIKSIEATKKTVAERDAFGKQVNEANSGLWAAKHRASQSKNDHKQPD